MSPWRAALDQALLLQKQPALAVAFKQAALPDGMPTLIRLASDEGGRRKDLAQLVGIDEIQLQSAATEYLLQICLYPGSNDFRVLGLNSASDMKAAKEHHRLLLKWLHPDRNPDNQILAGRVNQAWAAIKNNANSAVIAGYSIEDEDARDLQQAPQAGRFPLFLWGLIGLVAVLLIISIMPDSNIYVADSGSDTQAASMPGDAATNDSNDGLIERKLNALELSFGAIKKAVLPVEKVKSKSSKELEKKTTLRSAKPVLKSAPERKQATLATKIVKKNDVAMISQPKNNTAVVLPKPEENEDKLLVTVNAIQLDPAIESRQNLQIEAQELLATFRQNYRIGNVDVFMRNFSRSARNNRGDRQAIENDYASFFAKSNSRKITFSNEKWLFREDVVQYTARYTATVRRKGELISDSSKGDIEFIMSKENGKLLIQQILLND